MDGRSIVQGDDPGNGNNDRIILFSTSTLMQLAGRLRRMNVDCTFKVSPMTFLQLFVMFGLVSNCVWIPLFMAVLPNKSESTYERLNNLITMGMAAEGTNFQENTEIMMDFEAAQRSAWSRVHPSHRLRGCLFHYTQVI